MTDTKIQIFLLMLLQCQQFKCVVLLFGMKANMIRWHSTKIIWKERYSHMNYRDNNGCYLVGLCVQFSVLNTLLLALLLPLFTSNHGKNVQIHLTQPANMTKLSEQILN